MRIQEAQKRTDPKDPDADPYFFSIVSSGSSSAYNKRWCFGYESARIWKFGQHLDK